MKYYLSSVCANLFYSSKCFQTSLFFTLVNTLSKLVGNFWALVELFKLYAYSHFWYNILKGDPLLCMQGDLLSSQPSRINGTTGLDVSACTKFYVH